MAKRTATKASDPEPAPKADEPKPGTESRSIEDVLPADHDEAFDDDDDDGLTDDVDDEETF